MVLKIVTMKLKFLCTLKKSTIGNTGLDSEQLRHGGSVVLPVKGNKKFILKYG